MWDGVVEVKKAADRSRVTIEGCLRLGQQVFRAALLPQGLSAQPGTSGDCWGLLEGRGKWTLGL